MPVYLLGALLAVLLAAGVGLIVYHHRACGGDCPGCPYSKSEK